MSESSIIECIYFVVDENPFCIWDSDLSKKNSEFLSHIDPGFFELQVGLLESQLENANNQQRAALAIRTIYSHAQETFLALIGALVQSPHCVAGWIHKYRTTDLHEVIGKLHRGESVLSRLTKPRTTWNDLAQIIHKGAIPPDNSIGKNEMEKAFAFFWRRLASDFLDEVSQSEYNSIKHGFRAKPGGFDLSWGPPSIAGVPCSPSEMKSLGGSKYGSTFFTPQPVRGDNKYNFCLRHRSCNWDPKSLASRVRLIALSIGNVIAFLRILGGVQPETLSFSCPANLNDFKDCWPTSGVTKLSWNETFSGQGVGSASKEDILQSYPPAP